MTAADMLLRAVELLRAAGTAAWGLGARYTAGEIEAYLREYEGFVKRNDTAIGG